jgi:cobalt-zinc-cadmium efflux system outer membrane protein
MPVSPGKPLNFMPARLVALFALNILLSPLQAAPAQLLTLNSVADRIRAQNPDLAAARLRIDEALGRMNQSGRLANPELETSLESGTRFRERRFEVGFSQRFPVTDRLPLEKSVTAIEVEAARAEVQEVERLLITDARQAIVKVLAIRQRRELLKSQSALSTEFAKLLSEAAGRGEGSPLDAGQAKLEAASLAVEMRQLDASEAAAIGEIKPLLGMSPSTPVLVGGTLAAPSMPKGQVNLYLRPDYQAAMLAAHAAKQGVALEYAKRYDDLEAGFFAASERSEDAPNGYDREGIVGLRFRIPLPLWNRNEGNIQAAQATHERKEKETEALGRTIRLEVEAAKAEMLEWLKLSTELNDVLIPLAEEQATSSEKAFNAGQGELQAVFRSREKRLQLAGARLDAVREFHLARVRYEAALSKP